MKVDKFSNLPDLSNFIKKWYNKDSEITVSGDKEQSCSCSIANLCLRWSEFNSIKYRINDNEFSCVRINLISDCISPPLIFSSFYLFSSFIFSPLRFFLSFQ